MITRYAVIVFAMLTATCATHRPTLVVDAPPARVNPLGDAIVIELDESPYREVCVRAQPAQSRLYHCIQVGHLRASLEQWRQAKDWQPLTIRAWQR